MKNISKHFTRDRVTTALEVVGFGCVSVGIGMFSVPIAVIVAGILLIAVGVISA
jgi:hypothetical protein